MRHVAQLTIDGRFVKMHRNAVEASLSIGVPACGIQRAVQGRSKTSWGFVWLGIHTKHRPPRDPRSPKMPDDQRARYNKYQREYRSRNLEKARAREKRWKEKVDYSRLRREERAGNF